MHGPMGRTSGPREWWRVNWIKISHKCRGRKRKLDVIYPPSLRSARNIGKGVEELCGHPKKERRSGSGPRVLFSFWCLGSWAVQLLLRTRIKRIFTRIALSYQLEIINYKLVFIFKFCSVIFGSSITGFDKSTKLTVKEKSTYFILHLVLGNYNLKKND